MTGGEMTDFDPYELWLDIPSNRRPPTYYDLLGLKPGESDAARIDQAALRRMSRVRQHQVGPHGDQSQEILSELARARLVLLDPDRRADYDAGLARSSPGGAGCLPTSSAITEVKGVTAGRQDKTKASVPDPLSSLDLGEPAAELTPNRVREARGASPWPRRMLVIGPFVVLDVAIVAFLLHHYGVLDRWGVSPEPQAAAPLVQGPRSTVPAPTPAQARPAIRSVAPLSSARTARLPADPRPAANDGPVADRRMPLDPQAPGAGEAQWTGQLRDEPSNPDAMAGLPGNDPKARKSPEKTVAKADSGPEAILRRHGLVAKSHYYLLVAEGEFLDAVRKRETLSHELEWAKMVQRFTHSEEERRLGIDQANAAIIDLDERIKRCNWGMDRINAQPWGRLANSDVASMYDQLLEQRDSLEAEKTRAIRLISQFQSQTNDPVAKRRAELHIEEKTAELQQAEERIVSLVNETLPETRRDYEILRKDKEVLGAIEALGKKTRLKPRLGPSPNFDKLVKELGKRQRKSGGARKP
jgi:hypothetical protein